MSSQNKNLEDIVATATIIILNDKVAVALKYEEDIDLAPVIVAKGINQTAVNINTIGHDKKIPIVYLSTLSDVLYSNYGIGECIAEGLYAVIAEIVAKTSRPKPHIISLSSVLMPRKIENLFVSSKNVDGMAPFMITESSSNNNPRCAVVGFSPSGHSVINLMEFRSSSNIKFIRGDEDINQIKDKLQSVAIVFVAGELGEQTEDNIALVIAKIAKDAGALTIGIVKMPFAFASVEQDKYANNSRYKFREVFDSVIVVPHINPFGIKFNNLDIFEHFKTIESFLENVIEGILGVIFTSGDNDISLDFTDLKTVMSHQGIGVSGIGVSWGEDAACNAINKAIENANVSIKNASGILVHFTMHPTFDFMKLVDAMDVVHKSVKESADVIFGTTTDETLSSDIIRVSLIATGFEEKHMVPANNIF